MGLSLSEAASSVHGASSCPANIDSGSSPTRFPARRTSCIVAFLDQVVDTLEEQTEVSREQVELAGKGLADAAVKVLGHGLRIEDAQVPDFFLRCSNHVPLLMFPG